ncbi:MAG TPA: MAPEG family protein [Hyphomicrobiaceae bacterium]|jgi:hypothetical protein|nr:MAPEG family protein [Hyphomicrobiaceae bacterium]
MTPLAMLYPMLCQVALALMLWGWMARLRWVALRTRQVRPADIALGEPAWPKRTIQVANCFRNQFELPVLFYVLVLLVLVTRMSDVLLVVLAWVFVLSRVVHAYIHTGSNDVRLRGGVYGVGALALIVMWIWYALRLLSAAV